MAAKKNSGKLSSHSSGELTIGNPESARGSEPEPTREGLAGMTLEELRERTALTTRLLEASRELRALSHKHG